MRAGTPTEAHRSWAEAFQKGDIDALIDLYEDEAVFVTQPGGDIVAGKAAIRETLEGFLSFGASFIIERTEVVERDDLGLVYSDWTLRGGADPDGNPLDISAQTTDVVRRQPNGGWLFAIDNPWGTAAFITTGAANS
jgi:uncharacterized protein (TIGR02246 family)